MAKPLAVLIVEDSESDVQLIVRLLQKAGYKVNYEQVDTSEGMRAALKQQAWDIVISDYSLPQFDGSAALNVLHEMGMDIPFIVVSGTMGEETAVSMMRAGAHDYLMKGSLTRLVPAIERELEQVEVRRERRQGLEEIQARDKRFRSLIENSTDAITLIDASGKVIYDTPAAPGMLGYGPEDWIGRDIFQLVHPDDLKKSQSLFQNLLASPGAHIASTFRVRHKSGSWLWIEMIATNLLEEPSVNAIVLNYRNSTARIEAEQAVRESESILRGFLEQSTDAIMLTNEQGEIIQWSKGAETLTGYSRDESIGKPLWDIQFRSAPHDIKTPKALELFKTNLQPALLTGQAPYLNRLIEATLQRPDGSRITTQTLAFSIHTDKGYLLGSILRDITERKQAEETLRASEARFRGLFEDSPIAIWEEDFSAVKGRLDALQAEGITDFQEYFTSHPQAVTECAALIKVIDVNKAALKMLGANGKEDLFKGLPQLLKDEPNQEFQKELMQIASGKTSFRWEGSNRTLDGRVLNIDLSWYAAPGYEKSLAKVIISMIDITERKQAEEALHVSEKRFYSAFEYAAIGMALVAIEGHWLRVNRALCELLGYTNEELLEKTFQDITHPEDLDADLALVQELLAGKAQSYQMEKRYFHRSGQVVWVLLNVSLIRDDQGEPLYFISQIENITERKQAEENLLKSEIRYRSLFEDSPIALWEEDFSAVKGRLDGLRARGITDFQEYFTAHPEVVIECAALIKVLDVNKATLRLFGADHKEDIFNDLEKIFAGEPVRVLQEELTSIAAGKTRFEWEGINKTLDGRLINIELSWSIAPGYENSLSRVILSMIDITERKRAEEAVRKSERVLREAETLGHTGSWEQNLITGEMFNTGENLHLFFGDDLSKGGPFDDFSEAVHPDDREYVMQRRVQLLEGGPGDIEYRVVWPDGSIHVIFGRATVVFNESGQAVRVYGTNVDVTERRQAEAKLAEERNLLRTLIDHLPDRVYTMDMDGRKTLSNLADWQSTGKKTMEEVIGKTDFDNYPHDLAEEFWALTRVTLESGESIIDYEERGLDAEGNEISVLTTHVPLRDGQGNVVGLVGIGRDITDRKRADAERQALTEIMQAAALISGLEGFLGVVRASLSKVLSAENFFVVFRDPDSGLFEEVFSVDKYDRPMPPSRLEKSITSYVFRTGEPLLLTEAKFDELVARGELELVGKSMASWLGAPLKAPSGIIGVIAVQNYEDPNSYSERDRAFLASIGGQVALAIERKQAEAALARSEQEYRTLFENMPIGLYRTAADGRILDANDAMVKMFGYKDRESMLSANVIELYVNPASDEKFKSEIEKTGIISNFEAEFRRADGTTFWTEDHNRVIRAENGEPLYYEGSLIDITERKRVEQALNESRQRYRALFEDTPLAIWEQDFSILKNHLDSLKQEGQTDLRFYFNAHTKAINDYAALIKYLDVNKAALNLYKAESKEDLFKSTKQVLSKAEQEHILDDFIAISDGRTSNGWEGPDETLTGEPIEISLNWSVAPGYENDFSKVIVTTINITERKQAEVRIQRQLQRLAALRSIDQVITSSFDLHNSLTVILNHAARELGIDAADVLMLNPGYQSLEFSAGIGFHHKTAERASVRLGHDIAGRIALERQLIQIVDLKARSDDVQLRPQLAGEDFVSYVGLPLMTKGSVRGVLEIFNRTTLDPDQEWLDFLNTIAGQAALAIDNATLFESLQRSNIDLTLAYDATIEGWSHAMDLRDKETEGHTLRVTEMTMELAGLFGIKDEDMVGVRRGALLHDIGKMGVPDGILLKPDKLTDEEWVLMRKHPSFALEMLSPIRYLQSAIDIPYCHHEKWDGTGYPRGLKGEQIPLPARIFAIADVWDAVTSDRPYRSAWTKEKAIEYLRSEAGKHFDPQVLKVCLEAGVFDRIKPK